MGRGLSDGQHRAGRYGVGRIGGEETGRCSLGGKDGPELYPVCCSSWRQEGALFVLQRFFFHFMTGISFASRVCGLDALSCPVLLFIAALFMFCDLTPPWVALVCDPDRLHYPRRGRGQRLPRDANSSIPQGLPRSPPAAGADFPVRERTRW